LGDRAWAWILEGKETGESEVIGENGKEKKK